MRDPCVHVRACVSEMHAAAQCRRSNLGIRCSYLLGKREQAAGMRAYLCVALQPCKQLGARQVDVRADAGDDLLEEGHVLVEVVEACSRRMQARACHACSACQDRMVWPAGPRSAMPVIECSALSMRGGAKIERAPAATRSRDARSAAAIQRRMHVAVHALGAYRMPWRRC